MVIPPELAQGDPNDVLLFFNEESPPHGVRAQGRVSFREGRVAACAAIQWTGGPDVSAAVQAVLERHGATRVLTDVGETMCPDGRRPYDIVAVERRLFQALPPESLRDLVTDIATGRLTPLEPSVTAAEMAAARQRLQRQREITAGLRDATLQGMGLLVLGANSRRVCAAGLGEEDRPAVAEAIQGWRTHLPPHLSAGPADVVVLDRNGVAAAARRGECGAIFGDAASLRELEAVLNRDRLPATPAPVWLTPPEWEALRQRYQSTTLADRRRLLASTVNPLAERLMADLQAHIGGQTGSIGVEFAAFAQWLAQLKAASWSLAPDRFEIDDFGDATWSGGGLPAISVIVYFKRTMAGQATADCMIFVWLDDADTGLRREAAAFRCDAVPESDRWKRQRNMRSRWS